MTVCTQNRPWWHLKKYRNYSLYDEFHGHCATNILTEAVSVLELQCANTHMILHCARSCGAGITFPKSDQFMQGLNHTPLSSP
jgi:hypothetical protein